MIGLVDRALALNPSYARGWFVSGLLRVFAGQHDLAISDVETSLRLSPRERMGTPLSLMDLAYFYKRQFDEAAAKLLLAIQDHPGFPSSYRHLAACYAHMGRLDDAVQCALSVQTASATQNAGAADEPMQFRIGVHVGDVMVDGENLLGDGVNIA
jgi:class 3 adenylate cyclase